MRYQVGDLVLDLTQRRVTRDRTEIELSELSFRLLAALVDAAPGWVSLDELMTRVWPGLVVTPETVVQRVKLVREALADPAKSPRYIAAARRRGYRIVAAVAPLPQLSADQARQEQHASTWREASKRRSWLVAWVAGAAAVIAVAAVAALVSPSVRNALPPQHPRLAVLPFENLSPNPDDAYFAEGLHHEVIAAIAERAPSIAVISRTTMLSYPARPRTRAGAIAEELGAAYLVEGTVLRDLDRVRLTVNLIDARSEASTWSNVYDRNAATALTLWSEVARYIVERIPTIATGRTDFAERVTNDPAAYDFYLRALTARNLTAGNWHDPRERLAIIDELFSAAIAVDPEFSAAYAERAAVRIALFVRNFDTSAEHLRAVASDVDVAERLTPAAAKTHAARAWYLGFVAGDFEGAAVESARAQARGLADPMWMLDSAWMLVRLSRYDDAEVLLEHALAIDPANPVSTLYYSGYLAIVRRPHDALRLLEGALAKHAGNEPLLGMRRRLIFAETGKVDAAPPPSDPPLFIGNEVSVETYDYLRYSGRIDDLHRSLGAPPAATARSRFAGVGMEPVARYRGWISLLRGDPVGAAREGRAIFEFLASTEETDHNRSFRRLLAAEAYTFAGDHAHAVSAARESAVLVASRCCDLDPRTVAAVYAWSGAHADAVALLAELAESVPGLGPATIARDPLFTTPLGGDSRFRALVERLEGVMQRSPLTESVILYEPRI